MLGPQGTGFLYIEPGLELEPLLVGGTGGASEGHDQPLAMPERYESGTLNTPGIAGLSAGAEFLLRTGVELIRSRERRLTALIIDGLRRIPRVTIHGPGDPELQVAVVSFTVDGIDPAVIGFRFDHEFGISVRVGLHCAPDAHRTIGTYPGGTVRVSPGFFTTEDDIAAFLDALGAIAAA
jgi:selenocysteine lyase/cysteine desulfurase